MFAFFSNRLGCLGSIVVSLVGSLLLVIVLRLAVCKAMASAFAQWLSTSNALRSKSSTTDPCAFGLRYTLLARPDCSSWQQVPALPEA
jgi:hypothetical protein